MQNFNLLIFQKKLMFLQVFWQGLGMAGKKRKMPG